MKSRLTAGSILGNVLRRSTDRRVAPDSGREGRHRWRLRQVEFVVDGNTILGIEQNPKTKSRWAQMARSGKKVMQFIQDGRYVAVVVDGKVILYGKQK